MDNEKGKIGWEDFDIISFLGRGNLGEVFVGELQNDLFETGKTRYAIKRMLKEEVKKKKESASIIREKNIMKNVKSPFLNVLYSVFRDETYYYMVMELAKEGDVYSLIKLSSPRQPLFKKLGEEGVRFVLGCVILALEHLHSRNIAYWDLKPENILIFEDGYIKLSDFGASRQLNKGQKYYSSNGTPLYFAPEVAYKQDCGKELDLWTLGVLAYELSNFAAPFQLKYIMNLKVFKVMVQSD